MIIDLSLSSHLWDGRSQGFLIFPPSFLQPRYFLSQTALPFLYWEVYQMLV